MGLGGVYADLYMWFQKVILLVGFSGSASIDLCFVGQWENVGRRGRIGRVKLGFGVSYIFGTYDFGIMSELVECFWISTDVILFWAVRKCREKKRKLGGCKFRFVGSINF